MRKLNFLITTCLIFTFTINAQTFKASGDFRNQATFESNAPLEDIVGISNKLGAVVMVNPNDLSSVKGEVKVDLFELKTGIDLRDEHLRSERWLNTVKYPDASFELKKVTGASKLEEGKKTAVSFHGIFSIHGVSKEIVATGELTYYKESEKTKTRIKGNLLKVKADFNIKLSDYGVKIPDMVVGKVDENIKISANFVASDG
ncbi:YceI family protein [Bacteroidota bacterium]